uniref:Importin N-terminal domain-containing protein n=1 Tax=Guillardia theta TaxID=55529 RepID=A0A7S4KJ54_GUITH|mmetsp:Transcript_25642/g.84685  ORF Transcript_25642/g.84685 Transcript_25642/m.84685 type:complete len:1071 (+) Transcript_25642:112-3324(+)
MIPEVELLAEQLYGNSSSNEQRADAERKLSVLSSNPEMLDQARMILETSQQPYAQHFAATSMSKLLTIHWGRFSSQQKTDIRSYVFSFLANKGPSLQGFVVAALVNLLARITKLGWFQNPGHDVTEEVSQFLSASVDHCIIGLEILNELTLEMNANKTNLPLAVHRKKSISYRDKSLLQVLQIALQTLSRLLSGSTGQITPEQDSKLREQSLKLSLACLSYDFFGTSSDDSTEDIGSVQVPTHWRSLIEDDNTLATLLQAYSTSAAPHSAMAMECLSQLSSVRRSLFPNQETRHNFLQRVLTAIITILREQQRLGEEENFHEFCRLLSRLKSNFQLAELIKCEIYSELIAAVAQFTIQSIRNCPYASNSVYYLLQLWSRMVTSVAYLKGEGESHLDRYVPEITQTYILSKLQSARASLQSNPNEDPMENEELLVDQLDSASPLCRYQYERAAEFLISLFDPLVNKLQALAGQSQVSGMANAEVQMVEGELSWLVYFVGAVVGARGTSRSSDEQELLDGDLCARVFKTIQWIEMRQPMQAGGSSSTLERLELSLLYFFQYFRKAYIGEQANLASTNLYLRLNELVGLSDSVMVMNVIVNKTMQNLKMWSNHEEIVDKSLVLFHELASGYNSSKTLAKLDVITFALRNHGPAQFPFLTKSGNPRHRTQFYVTLTRILLMEDTCLMDFEQFMAPFVPILQHLQAFFSHVSSTGPGAAREEAKSLLIGVLRDLRGICFGTSNRRTYVAFFDWIYPDYLPMLINSVELWWNDSAVTTPLLKFVSELVHNKCQRIAFECSSPNGILLFREASNVLFAYGQRILNGVPPTYKDKYKGISICLMILNRLLSGGYVNFGVFQLYGDSALNNALNIVLQLSLSIPMQDLMAYSKVMRGYFPLQEILCHNHTTYLCLLETPVFLQIMSNIQYGLKWVTPPHDMSVSSDCAAALYHIAEFRFRASKKDAQALTSLDRHIAERPQMFGQLLALLLEAVVYDDCPNQWALSRPMLALILTNEEAFEHIKLEMCEAQPPDKKGQMMSAFEKLMNGVQRNLESRNRDRFTQNLTQFRSDVKAFLNP